MKQNNKSIELFGISGSGKSYIREKIKKKLFAQGYEVLDSREIIIKKIKYFTHLSFFEKIMIIYFNILINFNIKTTLWSKTLLIIVDKYLSKRVKKYNFYNEKTQKIIDKKTKTNLSFYKIWMKELITANLIFNDLKKKNKKIIFFPDEGFIQKIFILIHTNQKINKLLIQNYLRQKIFCDLIINIETQKKIIKKIHQIRLETKKDWTLSESKIKNMFLLEKKIKKTTFFKFKILKNYQKIDNQINNLIFDKKLYKL